MCQGSRSSSDFGKCVKGTGHRAILVNVSREQVIGRFWYMCQGSRSSGDFGICVKGAGHRAILVNVSREQVIGRFSSVSSAEAKYWLS